MSCCKTVEETVCKPGAFMFVEFDNDIGREEPWNPFGIEKLILVTFDVDEDQCVFGRYQTRLKLVLGAHPRYGHSVFDSVNARK
ncbi:hypothetical protein A1351_06605 [Methylosinus sp. R-45379]|nr:hypothetical protein A1351_06605 [Methylosinus sp. R-45379]